MDGHEYLADIKSLSPHIISISIKDRMYKIFIVRSKEGFHIQCQGDSYFIQESDQDEGEIQSSEEKSRKDMLNIKPTMPGKVIKIQVNEKEEIKVGQTLVIVEAMKMENEIKSSINGTVKKIFAAEGDLVDSDKPIMELEEKTE
ncbi:MAG: hypothetical protein GF421_10035 [Candidatus Aminicenantes bacterium]|nr:hypothetical protein [Candidatus Aminicenantes bacterium]